jgi:hypothetical protein
MTRQTLNVQSNNRNSSLPETLCDPETPPTANTKKNSANQERDYQLRVTNANTTRFRSHNKNVTCIIATHVERPINGNLHIWFETVVVNSQVLDTFASIVFKSPRFVLVDLSSVLCFVDAESLEPDDVVFVLTVFDNVRSTVRVLSFSDVIRTVSTTFVS